VILFAAAGWAGTHFLGWKLAFPIGVIAGLIIAPMVPAKTACSIQSQSPQKHRSTEEA